MIPRPTISHRTDKRLPSKTLCRSMEVKNSEASKESTDMQAAMEATAKIGWGPISATVKISGSVCSHKENTRSTDQSAKYHVELHASDDGMPEGLARVLDMIATSVAPKQKIGRAHV